MPALRLTQTRLALSLLAIYGSAATAAENSVELPEVTVVGQAAADGSAAQAVTCVRGSGNSFRVAAVMTPSVPSLPMSRWRRS